MLTSQAEAAVYRACRDQLDDRYQVLHSLRLIRKSQHGRTRDGEADFLLFDPQGGVTVIEVKGGGIRHEPRSGQWFSVDRQGNQHVIRDPFKQAMDSKYYVRQQLQQHPRWASAVRGRVAFAHGALFPSMTDVTQLVTSESPAEILGGRNEVANLNSWIESLRRYWADESCVSLGNRGVEIAADLFFRPIDVKPPLAFELEAEEQQRITLTQQQARILRSIGRRRRAVVAGGAGTGKTLLALQRAREFANEGAETLYVCYNRPLADHLRPSARETANLSVMSFHQLCYQFARKCQAKTGIDLLQQAEEAYPAKGKFEVQMPFALLMALDEIPDRYDAIIVDEAQDFSGDFWAPIEELLRDSKESRLLVFYDPNQAVYGREFRPPVDELPFVLTVNCRNTRHIHLAAYGHYQGEPVDPPDIEGRELEVLTAYTPKAQAKRIHALVTSLIAEDRIEADEIAILIAGQDKHYLHSLLEGQPLPSGASFSLESRVRGTVLVDSVKRFKGLETTILLLWGLEDVDPEVDRETLYVGLSRPKARLWLVGSTEACRRVLGSG